MASALADVTLEWLDLVVARRDHDLADVPVRHAALAAIVVEHLFPGDAEARLERAFAVVQAGVDHFGVARAGVRADRVGGFDHDHFASVERELACNRKPDDPGADHRAVNAFSHVCNGRGYTGTAMLTDRILFIRMADFWNTDWLTRSDMFAPLRPVAAALPAIGWPDLDLLNALAADHGRRIVNAQGLRVRFVPQAPKAQSFEAAFEPRAYLRGEVQVRPFDWHDLFNALVWVTFPTTQGGDQCPPLRVHVCHG